MFIIIWEIIKIILQAIWDMIVWVYLTLIPFMVTYIGIPLFILGILMGISFSGGSLIIMLIFFVSMYFFIKKTVFHNPF
jgi:hypothetical protein